MFQNQIHVNHLKLTFFTKDFINFVSGNPFVEVTKGLLHLYKENQTTSLEEGVIRSQMICKYFPNQTSILQIASDTIEQTLFDKFKPSYFWGPFLTTSEVSYILWGGWVTCQIWLETKTNTAYQVSASQTTTHSVLLPVIFLSR